MTNSAASMVTPLILTFNEEANIGRVLTALSWAARIVVVDSGSTDRTLAILARYPAVSLVHRPFDDHSTQWNFGLGLVESEWVLALDADHMLTTEFVREMSAAIERGAADGYRARFRYCIGGKPLRGSLYPPRIVLFCRGRGRYVQDGHTQLLQIEGRVGSLRSYIFHDDRKSLDRWLEAQRRYAALEAKKLDAAPSSVLSVNDRIRRARIVAPFLVFVYSLIARGGILNGRRGLYYAFQRLHAEVLLSLLLYERALEQDIGTDSPDETT